MCGIASLFDFPYRFGYGSSSLPIEPCFPAAFIYIAIRDMDQKQGLLPKFFDFAGNKTNLKTEIIAGFTTFATMAYIIIVKSGFVFGHRQSRRSESPAGFGRFGDLIRTGHQKSPGQSADRDRCSDANRSVRYRPGDGKSDHRLPSGDVRDLR